MPERNVFLIATAGGDPDPVVASLAFWRPARVHFVASAAAAATLDTGVVELATRGGIALEPGRWDILTVPDADDLRSCIARLRRLTPEVLHWLDRGDEYHVSVDLTGGTKCLSAALALHARRWPCAFSYVACRERGGDVTKFDAGDVVHAENPWDALGYQAVEDACDFFNQGHYRAAARVLEHHRGRAGDPAVKRELSTLHALASAYADWDCFEHERAIQRLDDVIKNGNDLRAAFGAEGGDRLLDLLGCHRRHLATVRANPVSDLVANAIRRARAGRHDDAVARLYRAVEALAQEALRSHGIHTAEVHVSQLPEDLRQEWAPRLVNGCCSAGLQDAYRLLALLGHELGQRFIAHDLHLERSPLAARNQSILAHGFQPVGEAVYRRLLKASLDLAGLGGQDLPEFPHLELVPGREVPAA